jgi:hypothetical protein
VSTLFLVRGAGVPTLLLVREQRFLLLVRVQGVYNMFLVRVWWEPTLATLGVRGVHGSMGRCSGRRGRLAIDQGTVVDLPLVS